MPDVANEQRDALPQKSTNALQQSGAIIVVIGALGRGSFGGQRASQID
jgi:hypothetical protein